MHLNHRLKQRVLLSFQSILKHFLWRKNMIISNIVTKHLMKSDHPGYQNLIDKFAFLWSKTVNYSDLQFRKNLQDHGGGLFVFLVQEKLNSYFINLISYLWHSVFEKACCCLKYEKVDGSGGPPVPLDSIGHLADGPYGRYSLQFGINRFLAKIW